MPKYIAEITDAGGNTLYPATKAEAIDNLDNYVTTKLTSVAPDITVKNANTAKTATSLATPVMIAGHLFDGTQSLAFSARDVGAYSITEIDAKYDTVKKQAINLGYGLSGTLTKRGNEVTFSMASNQTSKRPDGGSPTLYNVIPTDFRPPSQHVAMASSCVGANMMQSFINITFNHDGSINVQSYGANMAPVTITCTTHWSVA